MVHVRDIAAVIEDFAPLCLQESYDNAGLICGLPDAEVTSVLLCTDVTEEVIDEAIKGGDNMVISHHPLTLQGIKNLVPTNATNRCLLKAIRHDINLYAAHTNMDSVEQGVSGKMAEKLGLSDTTLLQPGDDVHTGFGIIGQLPEEMDATDFLRLAKNRFQCGVVRHTRICRETVRKVALCGGSGAFLIQQAIRCEADAYVTADIKYHDFFQADNRIILADIGHYESEQYTKEIFYRLLTEKFPKFAVRFSKVNTNPINYL